MTAQLGAVVRLLRPKQWTKNVLVFAAPAAAGVLDEPDLFLKALVGFVAFTLAASGTYCLNDAADAAVDAQHPKKRFRPVASGSISVGGARALGVVLLLAGIAFSLAGGRWQLLVATVTYVVLTTSYTTFLKHIAVVDLAAVAAGFVIRAIAGAAATGVIVSDWFLIVASFGSLFIVTGKRSAELAIASRSVDRGAHRAVLSDYTETYLTYMRAVSSGVTLLSYTLFAFEKADLGELRVPWFHLSVVPFGLAMFRYAMLLDRGEGGAPEEIVLSDRQLQILGGLWVILFMAGVYALS